SSADLPKSDRARINALAGKLRQESNQSDETRNVIDRLIEFIMTADDFAVARIRPYQLGDSWKMSRRVVLETCLRATRVGLLDLRWDLLCPLCRGAKDAGSSLKDVPN